MTHSTEVVVGIDVAKSRNAIAVAGAERCGAAMSEALSIPEQNAELYFALDPNFPVQDVQTICQRLSARNLQAIRLTSTDSCGFVRPPLSAQRHVHAGTRG